jgi:hypothetical protein
MAWIEDINNLLNSHFSATYQNELRDEINHWSVKLSGDFSNYSLYEFDKPLQNGELLPFFSSKEGVKIMSDYLIFAEYQGKPFILVAELKFGSKTYQNQIKATKIFAEYLTATVNRVMKKNYKPLIRGVGVIYTKIQKKGTKEKEINYGENGNTLFKGSVFRLVNFLK